VCSIAGCGLPGHQDGPRQFCKMNCPSGARSLPISCPLLSLPLPLPLSHTLSLARFLRVQVRVALLRSNATRTKHPPHHASDRTIITAQLKFACYLCFLCVGVLRCGCGSVRRHLDFRSPGAACCLFPFLQNSRLFWDSITMPALLIFVMRECRTTAYDVCQDLMRNFHPGRRMMWSVMLGPTRPTPLR
jgi:hypothetical protein